MDQEWRTRERESQIPAFGNWEYVNELPITQYFECARQAGLIRYSSSSGECDHPHSDLYSLDHSKPRPKLVNGREKRGGGTHVKEASSKKQGGGGKGKVFDVTVTEFPPSSAPKRHHPHPPAVTAAVKKKQQQQFQYDAGLGAQAHPRRAPKAVDEDLYKIPPELLNKRKKRLGFISRCLVPPCAV